MSWCNRQVQPLKECFLSCNDLDEKVDSIKPGGSLLQLPEAMIALDIPMAATSFVDKWGLVDVGQLGPASRYGLKHSDPFNISSSTLQTGMVHSQQSS